MENTLAIYEEQSTDVLVHAESIEVTDQMSYDTAAAFIKACTDLKKKIIEEHKPLKQKTKAAHQEACNKEKKHLGPVEKAISIFKRKMTAWFIPEQNRLREENEKLKAEAMAENPEAVPVFEEKKVEKPKGVSYRDNWKFRIADEQALPRPYLMPDERKIANVVKAMRDKTEIPGIEVYNEPIQVTR